MSMRKTRPNKPKRREGNWVGEILALKGSRERQRKGVRKAGWKDRRDEGMYESMNEYGMERKERMEVGRRKEGIRKQRRKEEEGRKEMRMEVGRRKGGKEDGR